MMLRGVTKPTWRIAVPFGAMAAGIPALLLFAPVMSFWSLVYSAAVAAGGAAAGYTVWLIAYLPRGIRMTQAGRGAKPRG